MISRWVVKRREENTRARDQGEEKDGSGDINFGKAAVRVGW